MPTSSSRYFRGTVEIARQSGLDSEALLASVGLSREEIDDPLWRGDVSLLAQMVATIIELLDDEFMGCASDRSRRGSFAMMASLVVYEPDLEGVIRKGVMFYSLMTDALTMRYTVGPDGGCWRVAQERPELDASRCFHDYWIMTWYRLWTWLIGEPPLLESLTLGYEPPPEELSEFRYVFGCSPAVGSSGTSLVISRHSLSNPVIRTRSELEGFLATTPLGVMQAPGAERSIARRVRATVHPPAGGPLEFPSFAQVAARLYLTEQTLRRRLRREATSYRALKESIRRDLATKYLSATETPVHEISRLVGYTEVRAFNRAFHSWTGMSPTQFRKNSRASRH